jgi:fermentation-respiration switch protein FrsA (DUF1100 family)
MKNYFLLLMIFFVQACTHVYYQPSKKQYLDPAQFKITYENIYFPSRDGTKLHAWFFPTTSAKPKGTIVYAHGNAQNLSTHFLNLVWIIQQGYNLFIFDYRGYGESEGSPNQAGVNADALAAFDKGHELYQAHGQGVFVVYGQSLGGAIILRALADYDQSKVDLIVQDSTFSSYKDIGFDRLTTRWFLVPFSPLAYVLVSDEYGPYKVWDKIKAPTLVIVGEEDTVVPAKFGKEIFKKISPKKKWLWDLSEAKHGEVFHNKQENYRKKFLELLDGLGRG